MIVFIHTEYPSGYAMLWPERVKPHGSIMHMYVVYDVLPIALSKNVSQKTL